MRIGDADVINILLSLICWLVGGFFVFSGIWLAIGGPFFLIKFLGIILLLAGIIAILLPIESYINR